MLTMDFFVTRAWRLVSPFLCQLQRLSLEMHSVEVMSWASILEVCVDVFESALSSKKYAYGELELQL